VIWNFGQVGSTANTSKELNRGQCVVLLFPYAKDVAQRQQSFSSSQTGGPSESEIAALATPLQLSHRVANRKTERPKDKQMLCVRNLDLNPIHNPIQSQAELVQEVHSRSLASWQICYANVQRFNYRARQLKYRHMKHKLKRI